MHAPLQTHFERKGRRESDTKKIEKDDRIFGNNAILPAFAPLTLTGHSSYDVARTIPDSHAVRLSGANAFWIHTELEAEKREKERERKIDMRHE
jgi:hypothetical protein